MYTNPNSDEISPDLLTANFNARSFLLHHRRENERNREISSNKTDHQHSTKYSTYVNPRGFARLSNATIPSHMINDYGIRMIDELSEQLLDDYLSLFRNHWQRSNTTFAQRIEYIQSELQRRTTLSLKKTTCEYAKVLSHWISKNKLR